jgi:hypothetical protein
MNISIDLTYFINKINKPTDKEFLKLYYEHINNHIQYTKNYIKLKEELIDLLSKYENNEELINIIKYSINIIENDAVEYKNNFKKKLLKLIEK